MLKFFAEKLWVAFAVQKTAPNAGPQYVVVFHLNNFVFIVLFVFWILVLIHKKEYTQIVLILMWLL